jgi:hypothetical protein
VGSLQIFSHKGKVNEIPMSLEINPITGSANYTWSIVYGEIETGLRPYELITVDSSKGHFLIDEKNSIRIEAYFIREKLVQWFKVQQSQLMVTVEKKGEELIWELFAGSSEPASTTGGAKIEEDEIPLVNAYPISTIQVAVLKRKQ